ncbi:hypothetical protein [Pseudomonas sp. CDFA 610]|uniref:hypothetical protein n=1 Tax=Pseudomonas sp. CDFA 610 TaxID=2829825 RepID=UPI001E4E8087|nr:hypothetical protein [Pseudomonas sp. CDFA 610]MCD5983940.1 hypothetical protein [Pseudomonas sp. CDFA 610]
MPLVAPALLQRRFHTIPTHVWITRICLSVISLLVLRQRFVSQFQQTANIRNNLHAASPDNTLSTLDKQLPCTVDSYQFQQDYFLTEKKGALFVRYTVLTTLYLRNGKPGRLIFADSAGMGQ